MACAGIPAERDEHGGCDGTTAALGRDDRRRSRSAGRVAVFSTDDIPGGDHWGCISQALPRFAPPGFGFAPRDPRRLYLPSSMIFTSSIRVARSARRTRMRTKSTRIERARTQKPKAQEPAQEPKAIYYRDIFPTAPAVEAQHVKESRRIRGGTGFRQKRCLNNNKAMLER